MTSIEGFKITAFYGGIASLFYVYQSMNVIQHRIQAKVLLGDGTYETLKGMITDGRDKEKHLVDKYQGLSKTIRAHANFGEYTPFILFQLGLLEHSGSLNKLWIHVLGCTLIISRLLHFVGLAKLPIGTNVGRFTGAVSTFLLLIVIGTLNVKNFLLKK